VDARAFRPAIRIATDAGSSRRGTGAEAHRFSASLLTGLNPCASTL
jgi:hypothetical protein